MRGIADEIIVGIDERTTDQTESIARACGARIYRFTWSDDFSKPRNLGLVRASKDWILTLDADARLTPWGAATIREVLRKPDQRVEGYCFLSGNYLLDGTRQDHALTSVRLWPRSPDIRYIGRVHEQPARHGRILHAGVLRGGLAFQHFGYDPSLYAARDKDARNLRLLELQYAEHPTPANAELLAHHRILTGRTLTPQ